ncbi:putative ribosome biogenesis GTPase RsgA [Desulfosarcina widdelii]|uniref:Small ribosomal subunit biogenesis GTPase RsgA n=1 Tax=Desulfosarcina widdelii TaxID=947919 RepID=A0A5K7Z5M2_9BACT|nr:ribosome small subunit-dependent GTPase A [Desulfosarcina widdelii]BBO77302.1 putative ribosome biogenesis GTPase RsgA [Desulfosarcina widdelii]
MTQKREKNIYQNLSALGWTSFFQDQLENRHSDRVATARVVGVRKNSFAISDGQTEWLATAAGKLQQANRRYPVVGDWVLVTDTVIHEVLERKNRLTRGAAGGHGKLEAVPTRQQVIAANLDTVFIVCGLDRDYNLRRIERYLTLVYNCDLTPAIILTKADLQPDPEAFVQEVETIAFGVPVHLVSARDATGLVRLEETIAPGRTITMIGSSGAGKSTLLNRLYGKSVQATNATSEKVGKGTHTTTSRDLIVMPQGGMIIDNPGIREISFWDADKGVESAFPEIERLAAGCRFSDCNHAHEPGCRVLQAVANGEIAQERLDSYHKMNRELTYLAERQHKSADRMEKERWKDVALKIKSMKKNMKK